MKQSNYNSRGAVADPMALLHKVEGHPQHRGPDSFDSFTERYEIVVLLPNLELTKGNKKCDADARTEDHGRLAF